MKAFKMTGIILVSLAVLAGLFLVWYKIEYSQGVIEGYTVNAGGHGPKVLIASQGSEFKEAVVDLLTAGLKELNASVKVVDITDLSDENDTGWDAVVLINAVEAWKLHTAVTGFLKKCECADNVIVLATSGDGAMLPEGIKADAITTASEPGTADVKAEQILSKLQKMLLQATHEGVPAQPAK